MTEPRPSTTARRFASLAAALGVVLAAAGVGVPADAQILNEKCAATILNRTIQMYPEGYFIIPNVPVPVGVARVRVVCEQDGTTYRAASDFVRPLANSFVFFPNIHFGTADNPLPVSLAVTSPIAVLTPVANTTQLTVTGSLFDGTLIDFTTPESGTSYASSNPAIASVDANGLVTAVSSGHVLITALLEGVLGTIPLDVTFDQDADNDGMPDDYEQVNAENPGGANLARLPGSVATASTFFSTRPPSRAIDGSRATSWFTATGDAANRRTSPYLDVLLPRDIELAQIRMFGNRESKDGFDIFQGRFEAFDALGARVFDSGLVELPPFDRDVTVPVDLDGIRSVRFTSTADESSQPGFAEIELIERSGGVGLDDQDPADAALDFDLDGLTNLEEFELGTSPFIPDTDGDGLNDDEESALGSNPLLADSDNDGLLDGEERNRSADTDSDGLKNIVDADSDNDLLPDGIEVEIGTNPLLVDSNTNGIPDGSEDGDLDGLPNSEEVLEHTDPRRADTDGDGILDGEEVVPGTDGFTTDPLRGDTDGDGMRDGFETEYGLNPINGTDAGGDPDDDGLTNLEESQIGTDPFNPDRTAPGVASFDPLDQAMDVQTNIAAMVRFNEPLKSSSVTTSSVRLVLHQHFDPGGGGGGEPPVLDEAVAGTARLSQDGLTVTFDPTFDLDPYSIYRIEAEGVRDVAGNRMIGVASSEFFTGETTDTTAPDVSRVTPINGATNVPTNAPFTIEFSERMDAATLTTANIQVLDYTTYQIVPGTIQVDPGAQVASFVPAAPYAVSRYHGVTLTSAIRDRAGNPLPYRSYTFTTAFTPDQERPSLLRTSPADGALTIPVNALVMLEFDEPVSSVGLGVVGGLRVQVDGVDVPGSIALSDANRRVTFTSATALAPNTLHTIEVTTDITDLARLPLANPLTASFRTSAIGDIVRPTVPRYTPVYNETGVPTNAPVRLSFSERVNPITVNRSSLTLTETIQYTNIAGTVEVAPDLLSATFTPTRPLRPYSQYFFTLNGTSTDYAGNTITYTNGYFTTGAGAVVVAPALASLSPPDGATGVPANAVVTAVYAGALDQVSIGAGAIQVFDAADAPVPGTLSVSGVELTFTPTTAFGALTQYRVEIGGFSDDAGNPVTPVTSYFTTGTVPAGNLSRTYQAQLTASSFYNSSYTASNGVDGDLNTSWCTASGDAANLNPGTPPTYEIRLPGPATISALQMYGRRDFTTTAFVAGLFELFAEDGTKLYDSGQVAFPAPSRDLVIGVPNVADVVRVRFTSVLDISANPCFSELEVVGSYADPVDGRFLDTRRPTSTAMTPANGATGIALDTVIALTFDERIDPTTVDPGSVSITLDGVAGRVDGSYATSDAIVTFTPANPLPPNRTVRITVNSNVRDYANNQANGVTRTFQTGTVTDAELPFVTMSNPVDGALDVGRTTPIALTFSEPLNPATVTADTIGLFLDDGTELGKTLSISADNTVVTLTLTLAARRTFLVAATSGITDFSGNRLLDFSARFSSGSDFDVTRPSIVTMRPGSGATRVSTGARVVLYANEALDPDSAEAGLFVSENGQLKSGTVSTSAGAATMEFVPDAPFATGAQVQVFATTLITDTDGNALNSYTGSFTVEPNPRNETAFVTSTSPLYNATGVGRNAPIEVGYSEPLDPATVNPVSVRLYNATTGIEIAGTVSLTSGNRVVRFQPTALLGASVYHYLIINGVRDTDAATVAYYTHYFTTGTASDVTAPLVTAISPPDGSLDVGVNARVVVRFDEPVNPLSVTAATISLDGPSGPVATSVSFGDANRQVFVTPNEPLEAVAQYDVSVAGVTDVAGNVVTPEMSSFTTIELAETRTPSVALIDPINATVDVPPSAQIVVVMNEDIDPASLRSDVVRVFPTGLPERFGTVTLADDYRTVTFVPNQPLPIGVRIDLWIQFLRDTTGNEMGFHSYYFTTAFQADLQAPAVLRAVPGDAMTAVPTNAEVYLEFDEPVSAAETVIELRAGATKVDTIVTFLNGQRWARIRPELPLSANTLHTVLVPALVDRAGNIGASSFMTTFTTGPGVDLFAPAVSRTVPGANQLDVPTNASLTVTFNERVHPFTVNRSTFLLYEYFTGINLTGTTTTTPDLRSATFTPDEPLVPFRYYYFYVTGGVTDLTGQALGYSTTYFTAGPGADLVGPQVTQVNPPDGATGVPANAAVTLVFDENLDPLSVTQSSARLLDGATPVPAVASVSGSRLTITPSDELAAAVVYQVHVDAVRDLAGNLVQPFTSSFTSASVPDGNLSRTFSAQITASSNYNTSFLPSFGADGDLNTSWCTASGDAANLNPADPPTYELVLPGPATVSEIRIFGRRDYTTTPFVAGIFQFFDAVGTEVYSSGQVAFPAPSRDLVVPVGSVAGVVRVLFTSTLDISANPCFSELEVVGSYADPRLAQFADTKRPTSTAMTPANAATNVALGTAIGIDWDEAIDPTSVDAASVYVSIDGITGVVGGSFQVADSHVTFTPSSPLPSSRTVRVAVNAGVRDLAGNQSNAITRTFQTGTGADAAAPSVVAITPSDGSLDVSRDTPVVITFSEPIEPGRVDASHFALFAAGSRLSPTVSRSGDNTVVTLSVALPQNTPIEVVVSDVTDFSGNALGAFTSEFRTASDPDRGRPSIVTTRPGSGATRVAPESSIVLYANEPLDPASAQAGLFVSENGVPKLGTVSQAAGPATIEFTPDAPFARGALVQVFATTLITDALGNALNSYQGSFTVEPDPRAETAFVVSTSPLANATGVGRNAPIEVRYSEPLDPATVNPVSVRLYNATTGIEIAGTVSLTSGNRVVRFQPTALLGASVYHYLLINGVRDTDAATTAYYTVYFTTGTESDTTPPLVTSISPPDGALDVGINAAVVVGFGEPVNPLSVTAATIALAGPGGATVPCTISFSATNRTVTVTPHTPLAGSSDYHVDVAGVSDVAGNLVTPASAMFRTRDLPDTRPPSIDRIQPRNSDTNVPVNAVLTAHFDEPIDPVSIRSDSFYVYPAGLARQTGTASAGADGHTIVFVPTQPLPPNLQHSWYFQSVRDVSGNEVSSPGYSFTTGAATDVTSPSVTGVSPPDATTAVPRNAVPTIDFSEPINEIQTLAGFSGIVELRAGATLIPVTVSSDLNGRRRLALTPRSLLEPDTTYTISVNGIQDRVGQAMAAPFTSSFTTGAQTDLIRPLLSANNPSFNITGVPTNTVLTLRFNEPMNPLLLAEGISLRENTGNAFYAGAAAVSADLREVTFTPAVPLIADRSHTWFISTGVTDLTSQTITSTTSGSFTTGAGPDTAAPEVDLATPVDGEADIPTNATVSVHVTEPLDPLTVGAGDIRVLQGGNPVAGTSSLSGRRLSFVPTGGFDALTTYTIEASDFEDVAGNAVAPFSSSFTTGTIPSDNLSRTDGVVVTSSSQYNSSYPPTRVTDGNLNTSWFTVQPIVLPEEYVEVTLPGDATIDVVRVFGNREFASGYDFYLGRVELFDDIGTNLFASGLLVLPSPDRDRIVDAALTANVRRIRFTATDGDGTERGFSELEVIGNFDDPTLGRFRDTVRPSMLSTVPANTATGVAVDSTVTITFDERIDPISVDSGTLAITVDGVSGSKAGTYAVADSTVTFTPSAVFPANATVRINVSTSVLDLAGNQANATTPSFRTAP